MRRLVILLAVAGCASGATIGSNGWEDRRTGVIYFQEMQCVSKEQAPPRFGEPTRAADTSCLNRITVTDDPNDPEAWLTESRVKMATYIGHFGLPIIPIPSGQHPLDVAFPSRDACDQFRTSHTYAKLNEPCRPIHFK